MEIYAATAGIENWVGEKMIQIYHHCGYHNEPRFFPFLSEKNIRNQARNQKMQAVVYYRLEHFLLIFYHFCQKHYLPQVIGVVLDDAVNVLIIGEFVNWVFVYKICFVKSAEKIKPFLLGSFQGI